MVQFNSLTEQETQTLQKVAKRRWVKLSARPYEAAFLERGNFTIALLRTKPPSGTGSHSVRIGVTKRNPIDPCNEAVARAIALGRALESKRVRI